MCFNYIYIMNNILLQIGAYFFTLHTVTVPSLLPTSISPLELDHTISRIYNFPFKLAVYLVNFSLPDLPISKIPISP